MNTISGRVILKESGVGDRSSDQTVDLARRLGLYVFQHDRNYRYGRNQQTCGTEAG